MFKIPQKQALVDNKLDFYVHSKTFDVYVNNGNIYQRIKDLKGCQDVVNLRPLNLARPEIPYLNTAGIDQKKVRSGSDTRVKIETLSNLFSLIKEFAVDTNPVYARDLKKKQTFCNVYAYHFLSAIGVYIPRIFWDNQSDLFQKGYNLYANCLEYSANSLTDWLITNAGNPLYPELELVKYQIDKKPAKIESDFDFDAIKTIGIISVFNTKGSGHIAILYRGNDGKLYATQAGAKNYQCDPNWLKWFSAPYLKRVLININIEKIND